MLKPDFFYSALAQRGTNFFTGVPDSLLKSFCAYVTDHTDENNHIIAPNEGCAIALASGHHFATGSIPLVYMQNSGQGNAINPLLSLADSDVYKIPLLLLIGWRGEPGVHDEPQHIKQGKVTCSLLDAMGIPYQILTGNGDELEKQLEEAYCYMRKHSAPYALVVKKGCFADYKLISTIPDKATLKREEAIETVIGSAPENAIFVSTTGMASRELFELREKLGQSHQSDFLTVGSMGYASQIALAIALSKPNRPVYCLDGDGATLMQMGGMTTIGTRAPKNLIHVVLNNGAHDSVGGQPTVGQQVDLCEIAKACGYTKVASVAKKPNLSEALKELSSSAGTAFLEILVAKGARPDLGRPTTTPQQNKAAFMEYLHD